MTLEVTEADILALCGMKALTPPDSIEITPATITLKYTGNRTDEAQALFMHGEGQLWRFDNDSDTQEWSATVHNGGPKGFHTIAVIQRR